MKRFRRRDGKWPVVSTTTVAAVLLVAGTLAPADRPALAHEPDGPVLGALSASYEVKDFAAAGVYSAGEEEQAREFIGYFLTLHGDHVVLPTSELCHVTSAEQVTLRDDRHTFGSAGGSWSEVGLARTSEDGYAVTDITFDCAGPFQRMIVQPDSGTYLLGYWAVFLVLGRE